eukprot:TRINITY_DN4704_c0_g2_i1.p1 TRINITY_DN4704_c0_g2~~TRINITY_DN4704_c0_g2_i1.p1  ORF type:complete len:196 (+),score=44.81 TRINITY_DN4704_c0_g2_i1:207-794(+)
MEYCRLQSFFCYFSSDTGLKIMVAIELAILFLLVIILLDALDAVESMMTNFSIEDLKMVFLFTTYCLAILSSLYQLAIGVVLLRKKDSLLVVGMYFYGIIVSGVLCFAALILKLTVDKCDASGYIFFGVSLGMFLIYCPYSAMMTYTYWDNLEIAEEKEKAKVMNLETKVTKIKANLELSIIPELPSQNEFSLRV